MGTNRSTAYPIGTDLGNKGPTPAALRAPGWRSLSQVNRQSVENVLRLERHN